MARIFAAHREILAALLGIGRAVFNGEICGFDIANSSAKPFGFLTPRIKPLYAHRLKCCMNALVGERAAVIVKRTFGEHDPIRFTLTRLKNRKLLGNALLNARRSKTDLKITLVIRIILLIRVNHRPRFSERKECSIHKLYYDIMSAWLVFLVLITNRPTFTWSP